MKSALAIELDAPLSGRLRNVGVVWHLADEPVRTAGADAGDEVVTGWSG